MGVVSLGFRVEFINLSGTGVLDWCDDKLFWRVKDRLPGGSSRQLSCQPP